MLRIVRRGRARSSRLGKGDDDGDGAMTTIRLQRCRAPRQSEE
jgi:hypothetical protein